ncbi:hypothetical protein D3C71_1811240 [compost metagenome]
MKSGDSDIRARMKTPSTSIIELSRKGTLHPQAIKASRSKLVIKKKVALPSKSPSKVPTCERVPKKARLDLCACSTSVTTAPPYSPPTDNP